MIPYQVWALKVVQCITYLEFYIPGLPMVGYLWWWTLRENMRIALFGYCHRTTSLECDDDDDDDDLD